ncbi:hypothetical protein UlMin_039843 [Ulmus minor]
MGRGKIPIKLIENQTNRQVTYSKRRNGIFKKAHELTVLCDARVSLIMVSANNKIHEYSSSPHSTKSLLDEYQRVQGVDLWKTHYERMQQSLRHHSEINNNLRREIRQRLGYDLDNLSHQELLALDHKVSSALADIRDRKNHKLKTTTETTKKKVRSLEEMNRNLLHNLQLKCEDPPYGLVEDEEGGYESAIALANGASNLYAFRHQQHPEFDHKGQSSSSCLTSFYL